MDKKSSAQKVIDVDKLLVEETGQSNFMSTTLYGLWGGLAAIAITAMGISYLTTDIEKRVAGTSQPRIDTITTASVKTDSPPITISQRRKQKQENEAREQKVDDLLRVAQRLRGEQISLNSRIVLVEKALKEAVERTSNLEKKLKNTHSLKPVAATPPRIVKPPRTPNLNPERKVKDESERIAEKSNAKISKAPEAKDDSKPVKLAKPVKTKIIKALPKRPEHDLKRRGTSIFTKKKAAKQKTVQNQSVDKTIVGSVNRAESTQFAIDLGVNPTEGRAKALWADLKSSAPTFLSNLTPHYIPTGNNEGETRIVAGPFLDASDAIRACVAVRTSDSFCKTSLFPK